MDGPDQPMLQSPRQATPPSRPPAGARRAVKTPRRKGVRFKPRFWALVVALVGTVGGGLWVVSRPEPTQLTPPELTPALRAAMLAAIAPGWPAQKPTLAGPLGPVPVADGRVDGVAALDVDGDGNPEWGVAYTWLGKRDPSGARPVQAGFAVLAGGDAPELLYTGPSAGGWNGDKEPYFSDASASHGRVEAVSLGADGLGFLQHVSAEMTTGGRLTQGLARLFVPDGDTWSLAWSGESEHRWRAGAAEETARTTDVRLEDRDGDGAAEVVTQQSWYHRRLDGAGRGPHFTMDGLGHLTHAPGGGRYRLSGLEPHDGAAIALRQAAPILAVRAARPIQVDGRFGDWDGEELVAMSGLRFEDAALLKYKRRDRHGIEDFSGDIRLLWDETALYVRASVIDDTVAPGPGGRELYRGDHLAVWLDWDLAGDFRQDTRNADDWQIGLRPAGSGAGPEAYCWVPKAGAQGVKVASRPLVDSYSGGVNGYEIESAIPWASLGGLPPGMTPGAAPTPVAMPPGQSRRYQLAVAGAMGFGAVLTDSDKKPQELIYVSNPGFTWAAPRSFNTLLLVEPRLKP